MKSPFCAAAGQRFSVVQPCESNVAETRERPRVWARFTARRSLHFPFTGGLFLANTSMNAVVSPTAPPPHPRSLPPRSGCLTTAAAAQECLPYNVTHISKHESALLLLCKEPESPRCSLSALGLFFQDLLCWASLTDDTLSLHISCCCKHVRTQCDRPAAEGSFKSSFTRGMVVLFPLI